MPNVEIRKHPMGPVPKWGLYFYWGRGITRVVFNRPLYPAHVDANDSEFQTETPTYLPTSVSGTEFPESWRAVWGCSSVDMPRSYWVVAVA